MYAECKYYVGGISHMMFSLKSSFRMVFIFFCLGQSILKKKIKDPAAIEEDKNII